MNLKGLIQDMRDGIGSISRRRSNSNGNSNSNNGSSSFDLKLPYRNRSRSLSAVLDESQFRVVRQNSLSSSSAAAALVPASRRCCWASMPPELLRDIISRVESSETLWPPRRALVACAGVCRTWRQTTKELVSTVEDSGKLTFPISLKQPGPRDLAIQCFIKRNRTTSTYRLYLGLTPTLGDPGKFLLAARKVRRPTGNDYIISLDADDMSRGSNTYVGKLRSNFLGTKFTIYDSQPPPQSNTAASSSMGWAGRRVGSKGSFSIANIAYELNVLGTRGPRRMQCAMHSIPASAMEPGGPAPPTPLEFPGGGLSSASSACSASNKSSTSTIPELFGNAGEEEDNNGGGVGTFAFNDGALVLKNKAPRWHEQLQCWCLNFQGRVTVASVKNFQLVAAPPPEPASPTTTTTTTATTIVTATTTTNTTTAATTTTNIGIGGDYEKVLLQFGKVSTDVFTMDYRYPLSASQAFAICLSSFDTKLACE